MFDDEQDILNFVRIIQASKKKEAERKDRKPHIPIIYRLDEMVALGMRDNATARDVAFFTRIMMQSVIPKKATDKREVFVQNGHWKIGIQAGSEDTPLPSGAWPRLILIWIITLAVKRQTRFIDLGQTITEFMDNLNIHGRTGGERGMITHIKKASKQLFRSRVSFEYTGPKGNAYEGVPFADGVYAPWLDEYDDPVLVEGYKVRLHEAFYDYIAGQSFPLDWSILRTLSRSPLGIDLYVWLTYRVFTIKKPVAISWSQLNQQFGCGYDDTKNFSRRAKKELVRLKTAWPDLNYSTPRGRLVIHPSLPSIPPKRKLI